MKFKQLVPKTRLWGALPFILGLSLLGAASFLAVSCTSGNPPPLAKPATAASAWVDFNLYLCSPDDLTAMQKQSFQGFAMAAPAFLAGLQFSKTGLSQDIRGSNDLQTQGVIVRQSHHRDGLAIWQMEGRLALPPDSRSAAVALTIPIEVSTLDPELAAAANNGQYPANRLLVVMANRAVREAVRAGHSQGNIRLAILQYDSSLGRFKAKFEIF